MLHLGPAALLAAFAAGVVAFSSPCVFPLIPGYLSFVSGVSFDELGTRPRRVVTSTAAFVLGFGVIFILLGAGVGWFGNALLLNRRPLEIVAGIFIALAGLIYAGLPMPRFLLAERRIDVRSERKTMATATVAGAAFGIGWTPCIGPTLAAILALAAGGSPTEGAVLLAAYTLGLGIPFLVFGLLFTRALGIVRWMRQHWRVVSLTSGGLLVTFGVLLASGELVRLTVRLSRFTGWQI